MASYCGCRLAGGCFRGCFLSDCFLGGRLRCAFAWMFLHACLRVFELLLAVLLGLLLTWLLAGDVACTAFCLPILTRRSLETCMEFC